MADPPSVEETMAWVGWRLDEIEGSSVGRIEGVYVDARTGEAAWLFAKIGRFGRRSLVPVRDAVGGVGHVWVPYEREVIRGAPRIEPGQTLDIYRESELSAHYEVDRSRRLAGRPPGDVTSRPA